MPACTILLLTALLLAACGGGGAGLEDPEPHPLDGLEQAIVGLHDQPYRVWVARTADEQERGLQGITEEEIAPLPDGTERGMLFVFPFDQRPAFWMRDTIVPLDLAFLLADGTIAETYALQPLDETRVQPALPVRYALELRGGAFDARGIGPGDVVDLAAVAD